LPLPDLKWYVEQRMMTRPWPHLEIDNSPSR
jgi:hypothetical protein